jgi:hypothetical protein
MQLFNTFDSRRTRTEAEDGGARMQLKTFRLIWTSYSSDTSVQRLEIQNIVHCHDGALRELRKFGMEIHIGDEGDRYI